MIRSKLLLTRVSLAILIVALAIVAVGCGGNENTDAPANSGTEPTQTQEQEPDVTGVYWRQKKYLDSKNNTTLRKPNENGIYTVEFYCDGEIVDVRFKDKKLVETIDSYTNATCHFGLVFDELGYAVEVISSAEGSHTLLQCERYDITEINEDGSYKAAEIIKHKGGKKVQGVIGEDCKIYDISAVAKTEGAANRQLETVSLNDRVCIWTDAEGKAVLIYVTSRQPNTPLYYNPDPQYNAETKKTDRKKNAEGYYEIELLEAGKSELQTFYTREEKLVNTIDRSADRCVGLKLHENNVIEFVYDMESVLGQTYFCRGYYVTDVTGSQISCSLKESQKTAIMAESCKVWDVSDSDNLGAETELRAGDFIYAGRNPYGEIVNIYVISRGQTPA